ncbi:Glycosyl transferase family 2 [Salinimicrobium catena]|uniref:Glycosyl transferase family 2 n=1 Tax=Salinimicrobium catena TaxID=390640 RepID=A0A1H5NJ91_9FLAO|nr:glycosyltransferase family 2 protein [Salinimicrobium catena]SDL48433.1 Glycosyl transferase family 2 [Salinimicrobium catena]SEF01709.1 Glycosyl transferase family 2 [Salinimicrobium catena]
MNIYIVIPAHNEEAFLADTLQSLVDQTLQPKKLVVVDDQSSDNTAGIAKSFAENFPFIELIRTTSSDVHLPGSKIVNAFQKGLKELDKEYDVICKFDADLIFPKDYLEDLSRHFSENPKAGMVGGFCYIKEGDDWKLESLTNKDHIRGALKAYRKECFEDIGGLKPSMGWDTADELLAQYHGWEIVTDLALKVKHLRPTGFTYNKKAKWKQGEAFYKLRYGFIITSIASLKLALKKKRPVLFTDYLGGYFRALLKKSPFLVTKKEGAFIRRLRYKKMFKKLF